MCSILPFGLCCSHILEEATRQGAIAGMVSGAIVSLFWLLFEYKKTAEALGIAKALFGARL